MKKMHFILMSMLLPLVGLCQQETKSSQFSLTIKASMLKPATKVYLLYQTEGRKFIDSATQIKKNFRFRGNAIKPLRATLVLDDEGLGIKTILEKKGLGMDVIQFYLHPGIITATATDRIADARFLQSDINKDFSVYQSALDKILKQQRIISLKMVTESDTTKLTKLRQVYDSLKLARLPLIKQFIISHPSSYIALVAWQEYNGHLQSLDGYRISSSHLAESKIWFDKLDALIKNTEDGMNAARQFSNNELLAIGAIAPEFSQPDVNGKMVRLSDFKGKYVLLDFWASWCGPCRQNNPALVKLYHELSSGNFTILGISLDEKDGRQKWLKAIKDDGLLWTQVSDLKHWDNQVAKLYTIAAIPQSILIGPDGTIIANGISVEDLRTKLNDLLPAK